MKSNPFKLKFFIRVRIECDEAYPVYSLEKTPDTGRFVVEVPIEFYRKYERVMRQYNALQKELQLLEENRHASKT